MKIAVFSTSREWHQYFHIGFTMAQEKMIPLDVDHLYTESQFWQAMQEKRYELVLICSPLRSRVNWGFFLSSLERLWHGITKNHAHQVWNFAGKIIALKEEEIYYLFSVQKEVSVYVKDRSYRIGTNMKQEEERLPSASFFRIHRNCLVNLIHVKQMDDKVLTLRNGVNLSISSRRKKKVREKLLLFWEEKDSPEKNRESMEGE